MSGGAGTVAGGSAGTGGNAGTGTIAQGGTPSTAGTGGDTAGPAENGGAGGAGGDGTTTPPESRWFVFAHDKGLFAYDSTAFPDPDALVQVGSYGASYWSPNGRQLLHFDVGNWSVNDMSGATPGAALLLLDHPKSVDDQLSYNGVPQFAWSSDSLSLATVAEKTLSVLDPSKANPTLHAVTTSLKSFQWAPKGSRLLYVDATGSHVVSVTGGVLGASQDIDASASTWSPNGAEIAGTKAGNVTLTRLGNGAPALVALTNPVTAEPDANGLRFNADGSMLTFNGQQDRAMIDVYYVKLGAVPSAPKIVHPALPDSDLALGMFWSPDGKWFVYTLEHDFQPVGIYAVDLSGATPATPVEIKGNGGGQPVWSPLEPAVFRIGPAGPRTLNRFSMLQPNAAPVVYYTGDDLASFGVSPNGLALAWSTTSALHFINVDAPQGPVANLPLDAASGNISRWDWAPNSHFVSYVDTTRQQRLVRLDGSAPSAPLPLQTMSKLATDSSWQP